MHPRAERRFIRTNRLTIVLLFLVIAAGGIVRSTGAGMGCPDWPKCFDRIIPPTDIAQLPEGYEAKYIAHRAKKNQRFAKLVERFGYPEMADKIRHDESILRHEEFNAAKTWTEYINRLCGVMVGFGLLFTAVFSLAYRKSSPSIVFWSVLNLFAVIVQAWLGSVVVSTNLMPWVITVHMLLALVILAIAIHTFHLATTLRNGRAVAGRSFSGLKVLAVGLLLLTVAQVGYGTEVREGIDRLNAEGILRLEWIGRLDDSSYLVHRVLAYITLGGTVLLFFWTKNRFGPLARQYRYAGIVLALALGQMLTGVVMARFGLPAFAQTSHLVLASLFFGAQYYLMLLFFRY